MAAEYGNLPFDQAIEFFRGKISLPSETWKDLWQKGHTQGFVVAGAMKGELLADLRREIDQAISEGTTLDHFRKRFDHIVRENGWSYKGGRGWRTEVMLNTNIRTAYHAGRYVQQMNPAALATRPYLEYRHGDSVAPREEHVSWDRLVLRADDPWWNTHYPPNGWGCTCKTFALSVRDLKRLGKTAPDTAPPTKTYEWTDKDTGEVQQVPVGIDPGWDYSPGKEWYRGTTPKFEESATLVPKETPLDTPMLAPRKIPKDRVLSEKVSPDESVSRFLGEFDTQAGLAIEFEDVAGEIHTISDALFRDIGGRMVVPADVRRYTPLMADTLKLPDELWLQFVDQSGRYRLVKTFLARWELPGSETISTLVQMDSRGWTARVANAEDLLRQRAGKLLYRRG